MGFFQSELECGCVMGACTLDNGEYVMHRCRQHADKVIQDRCGCVYAWNEREGMEYRKTCCDYHRALTSRRTPSRSSAR